MVGFIPKRYDGGMNCCGAAPRLRKLLGVIPVWDAKLRVK
jgi:hypothetical protein